MNHAGASMPPPIARNSVRRLCTDISETRRAPEAGRLPAGSGMPSCASREFTAHVGIPVGKNPVRIFFHNPDVQRPDAGRTDVGIEMQRLFEKHRWLRVVPKISRNDVLDADEFQ